MALPPKTVPEGNQSDKNPTPADGKKPKGRTARTHPPQPNPTKKQVVKGADVSRPGSGKKFK